MDQISEFLGISKATVYNHFTSKEEIIEGFIAEKCIDLEQFNILVARDSAPVFECYQKSLYHLLKHMCDISPVVRRDLATHYPQLWSLLMNLLDAYLNRLKKLYARGIQQGVFNPINPQLMMVCDRNMILFLSDSDQLKECGLTLRNAFDEFIYMRRNGILRTGEFQAMKSV